MLQCGVFDKLLFDKPKLSTVIQINLFDVLSEYEYFINITLDLLKKTFNKQQENWLHAFTD